MGLIKVIKERVYPTFQLFKYFKEVKNERNAGNILPINPIYVEQLSNEYLMGYPLSMYLLFNQMPEIRITQHILHGIDSNLAKHMIYQLNQDKKSEFYYRPKDIAAYALHKKMKLFDKDAKLYLADLRAYGKGFYIQDDKYAYDLSTYKMMPIESFYNIYNPKNIQEVVNTVEKSLIDVLTTKDTDKLTDDLLSYVNPSTLDTLYEEADDELSTSKEIHEARINEITKYFNTINYKYKEGIIAVQVK